MQRKQLFIYNPTQRMQSTNSVRPFHLVRLPEKKNSSQTKLIIQHILLLLNMSVSKEDPK